MSLSSPNHELPAWRDGLLRHLAACRGVVRRFLEQNARNLLGLETPGAGRPAANTSGMLAAALLCLASFLLFVLLAESSSWIRIHLLDLYHSCYFAPCFTSN